MMRTLDFWVGNGAISAWYGVFYLGLAAGYFPYAPQLAERFRSASGGPESLGVFAALLMAWGAPLLLFSAVNALVFLACGGGTFGRRLLWGAAFVVAAGIAIVAASLFAAGSPTAGLLGAHAILAALVLVNLSALWLSRRGVPVGALFSGSDPRPAAFVWEN